MTRCSGVTTVLLPSLAISNASLSTNPRLNLANIRHLHPNSNPAKEKARRARR